MRYLLVSDVHGNLPALEAVLRDAGRHHYDRILSLGDQINLGPCGPEVLKLLKDQGAVCLRGNHERYVLSAMAKDPAYDGANFASLHFNASLFVREELLLPEMLSENGICFCHALPGDDRFPVFDTERIFRELPDLSELRGTVLCGHGHNPTFIRRDGLAVFSIGSTGTMDEGLPGMAPYTILDVQDGIAILHPFWARYDPSVLPGLFLSSGMAEFCPIMAHICCLQMQMNQALLLSFVGLARKLSAEKNESVISKETWSQTDCCFGWPDGLTSNDFWRSKSSQ